MMASKRIRMIEGMERIKSFNNMSLTIQIIENPPKIMS
jgi:hypothetical protein